MVWLRRAIIALAICVGAAVGANQRDQWLAPPGPDPTIWETLPPGHSGGGIGDGRTANVAAITERPEAMDDGIHLPVGWTLVGRPPVFRVAVEASWPSDQAPPVALMDQHLAEVQATMGADDGWRRLVLSNGPAQAPSQLAIVARGGAVVLRNFTGDLVDPGRRPASSRTTGGLLGAAAAALLAAVGGTPGAALAAGVGLGSSALGDAAVENLIERLRLSSVEGPHLRWAAYCLALAVLGLGRLVRATARLEQAPMPPWLHQALSAAVVLATAAATPEPVAVITVLVLAVSGLRAEAAAGFVTGDAVVLALAAMLALCGVVPDATPAWLPGLGLSLLALWRLLALARLHTPPLAGPRLLVASLALLLAVEATARATQQGEVWRRGHLEGDGVFNAMLDEGLARANGVLASTPAYQVMPCGPSDLRILFIGGSATGGATQFADRPEIFFAPVLATVLCQKGIAVQTINTGRGDNNTELMRREIDRNIDLYRPSIIVAYTGNNDSAASTLTLRDVLSLTAERPPWVDAVRSGLSEIRTYQALRLLVMPSWRAKGGLTMWVTPEQAAENLGYIHERLALRGGRMLMVSEFAYNAEGVLSKYWETERALADRTPGLEFRDIYPVLGAYPVEKVLVDAVHPSVFGHQVIARTIADWLIELGWVGPQASATP